MASGQSWSQVALLNNVLFKIICILKYTLIKKKWFSPFMVLTPTDYTDVNTVQNKFGLQVLIQENV